MLKMGGDPPFIIGRLLNHRLRESQSAGEECYVSIILIIFILMILVYALENMGRALWRYYRAIRWSYADSVVRKLRKQGLIPRDERIEGEWTVAFENWNENDAPTDLALLVKEILLPVVRNNIRITLCAGCAHGPVSDGTFHIFIHSAPSGFPDLDSPKFSWGNKVSTAGKAFAPSALGVPICDDNGFVAAELLDHNLYSHRELLTPLSWNRAEATFLGRLLVAVRAELTDFERLTVHELDTKVERQLGQQCLQQFAAGAESIDQAESALVEREFQQQLGRTVAAQSDNLRMIMAPENELGREFDALFRIGKVTGVETKDDYLVVSTVPLNCRDPRTGLLHRIGTFRICISLLPGGSVYWANTTPGGTPYGFNAPHVDSGGYACLGNMREVFHVLISERDFPAAVEAAIAFVESVNVNDSWGAMIDRWPLAETAATTQPATAEQAASPPANAPVTAASSSDSCVATTVIPAVEPVVVNLTPAELAAREAERRMRAEQELRRRRRRQRRRRGY